MPWGDGSMGFQQPLAGGGRGLSSTVLSALSEQKVEGFGESMRKQWRTHTLARFKSHSVGPLLHAMPCEILERDMFYPFFALSPMLR